MFIFYMGFLFSDNVNTRLKEGYGDIVKVIQDKNYISDFDKLILETKEIENK